MSKIIPASTTIPQESSLASTSLKSRLELTPFIFSLDDGLTWNPCGRNHPKPNSIRETTSQKGILYYLGWTWCHPDIVEYVKNLPKHGFYPVFYTEEKKHNPAIDEIMSYFSGMNIPVYIGEDIYQIKEKLKLSAEVNIPILPSYPLTGFDRSGRTPSPDFDLENIGVSPFLGNGYFTKLNKDPKSVPDIIILMGQPGSGKTQLSRRLVSEYNFIHLDEDQCARIRKNPDQFLPTLSQMKSKSQRCVLDSTNRSRDHRKIYIDIALKHGFTYVIGWLTRPGHRYDELRGLRGTEKRKGSMALNSYTSNFEAPSDPELWVRLT